MQYNPFMSDLVGECQLARGICPRRLARGVAFLRPRPLRHMRAVMREIESDSYDDSHMPRTRSGYDWHRLREQPLSLASQPPELLRQASML